MTGRFFTLGKRTSAHQHAARMNGKTVFSSAYRGCIAQLWDTSLMLSILSIVAYRGAWYSHATSSAASLATDIGMVADGGAKVPEGFSAQQHIHLL